MFAKKIYCLHCGAKNYVSKSSRAYPRCGTCTRPLFGSRNIEPPGSPRRVAFLNSPWPVFWSVMVILVVGVAWYSHMRYGLGLQTTSEAHADASISGRASVIDGDTIEIHGERVRLWGIDAPEGGQRCSQGGQPWRCGTDAANALDSFLADRPVTCTALDRDRYRRIVAICKVSGEDLGAWLVRNGWALDYARYSGGSYSTQQNRAEADQRGIWQGEFEAPWDWRRR